MTVALNAMGMTLEGQAVRVFEDYPIAAPTTVAALIVRAPPEVAVLVEQGATVLVNGERATVDTAVVDGDEISIVHVVAGG